MSTAPILYCSVQTGSLSTVYRNGVALAGNANGLSGPNGLSIGGGEWSDAQVAEILVYDSALGAAALNNVELYMKAKYGL